MKAVGAAWQTHLLRRAGEGLVYLILLKEKRRKMNGKDIKISKVRIFSFIENMTKKPQHRLDKFDSVCFNLIYFDLL